MLADPDPTCNFFVLYVLNLRGRDRPARVNVNATHVKKKFSKTLILRELASVHETKGHNYL